MKCVHLVARRKNLMGQEWKPGDQLEMIKAWVRCRERCCVEDRVLWRNV